MLSCNENLMFNRWCYGWLVSPTGNRNQVLSESISCCILSQGNPVSIAVSANKLDANTSPLGARSLGLEHRTWELRAIKDLTCSRLNLSFARFRYICLLLILRSNIWYLDHCRILPYFGLHICPFTRHRGKPCFNVDFFPFLVAQLSSNSNFFVFLYRQFWRFKVTLTCVYLTQPQ